MNKQPQHIRDKVYAEELRDTKEWNRAKVRECIVSAVIMAQRFPIYSKEVVELINDWPADSSVRYEWFRHIAMRPELKVCSLQRPTIESMANVYRVLALWLHRIDSNMDRVVLIMNSCGVSFDNIVAAFPEMNWRRQTLSRRHTKMLDALVYDLNRIDELKYPAGVPFTKFK